MFWCHWACLLHIWQVCGKYTYFQWITHWYIDIPSAPGHRLARVYLKTEASELVSQTSETVPSTDSVLQKFSLLQTCPLISWSVDYSCPNSCHHIVALIFIINGRMIVNFLVIANASEVLVQFCEVCLETWLRHGGWEICYLKPLKHQCTLDSKIPQ